MNCFQKKYTFRSFFYFISVLLTASPLIGQSSNYAQLSTQITSLTRQGKFSTALTVTQEFMKRENFLTEKEKAKGYFLMGNLYGQYALANLDSSLYFLELATQIAESIGNDTLIAKCYERLGVIHHKRSQRTISLVYYQKSARIYEKLKNKKGLAIITSNLAVSYSYMGNYQKSNQYLKQILPILDEFTKYKDAYISSTYSSLGSNYWELGDFEAAALAYKKGFAARQKNYSPGHNILILDLINLASTFHKLGDVDSAITLLEKGIVQADPNAHASLGELYKEYGFICEEQKNYTAAALYSNKALDHYRKLYQSNNNVNIANIYTLLSQITLKQKYPRKALQYIQKALIFNSYNFSDSTSNANPKMDEAIDLHTQLDILIQKGKVYLYNYRTTKVSKDLDLAWESLQLALHLIDHGRTKHYNDYPLLMLRKDAQKAYRVALSCLYELGKKHPQKYLSEVFQVFEQSKAYSFLAHTQQQQNSQEIEALPKPIKAWQLVTEKIEFLESQLLEEQQGDKDPTTIKKLEAQIFESDKSRVAILAQIQAKMPAYYNQYFNVNYVSLVELQTKINDTEAVVEFLIGEEDLFILKVEAQDVQFVKLKVAKELEGRIQLFRKSILAKNDSLYLNQATALYQLLFSALNITPTIKKICLLPDKQLHFLTFDALLTNAVPLEKFPNYQQLPYLIKQYQLFYGYSATVWAQYQKNECHSDVNLTAFAPEFKTISYSKKGRYSGQIFNNLPGSALEVEKISALFPTKEFLGSKATKAAFYHQLEEVRFAHLATHGLLNDQTPAYSAIAFSGENQQVELLYAHELYGQQFPLEMLTLSTCNSGIGKLEIGEGMMSLARNFALAGCPSIVMSFWEVADQSAPFIFPQFYRYLAAGDSKDLALQKAKIDYIQHSDVNGAHPYYWAGIALIGNNKAIITAKTSSIYWAFGVFAIVILSSLYFWKKKQPSS